MMIIKKNDFVFIILSLVVVLPFLPLSFLENFHSNFLYSEKYWLFNSFFKFAILGTLGELIGLRIKTKEYIKQDFGIFPRAIFWGILGISIKISFIVFPIGVVFFLEKYIGLNDVSTAMKYPDIITAIDNNVGFQRIIGAFCISVFLNIIFAPVMMTFHKITDTHIAMNNGKISCLFKPIRFGQIIPSINWFVQWDFVFKRTIPIFWIPAHTVTFLIPSEYRIIFAALLGVILGILLAIASIKGNK